MSQHINLDYFVEQYLKTALWISADYEDTPLDKNYSLDDIATEAKLQATKDCKAFIERAGNMLYTLDDEQCAHDFWLTRNRHGAGFWDRGYKKLGDSLTTLCHEFGQCTLYVNDDNKIDIA